MINLRGSAPERGRYTLLHSIRSRAVAHLDTDSKDTGVLSPGVNRLSYESDVLFPPSARVWVESARSS
jgi:hypothetical protein